MRRQFYTVLRNGKKTMARVPANARMIALQKGEKRLFFILDSYPHLIDLVKLMGSRQPVLSLIGQTQRIDSFSIGEEAATHAKTILAYQPHGPYMLGGCSAQGVVAYETAQQLRALGHEVGLLAIFDLPNPYVEREHSRFGVHLAFWRDDWSKLRWKELPGWAMGKIRGLIDRKVLALQVKLGIGQGGMLEDFGLLSARVDAAANYQPAPYAGRLLLVKRTGKFIGRLLHPCFGWSRVVQGRIDICEIRAIDHLDIFKSEADRVLIARALLRAIDEVAEESRCADPAGSSHELAQQA